MNSKPHEGLTVVRHCSKDFTHVNSYNPQSSPAKWVPLLHPLFIWSFKMHRGLTHLSKVIQKKKKKRTESGFEPRQCVSKIHAISHDSHHLWEHCVHTFHQHMLQPSADFDLWVPGSFQSNQRNFSMHCSFHFILFSPKLACMTWKQRFSILQSLISKTPAEDIVNTADV